MKNNLYYLVPLILLAMFANACILPSRDQSSGENSASANNSANQSPSDAPADNSTPEANAKVQDEIRKVDFKNFTYTPYCADEETTKVTVKKGEYSLDKGDDKLFFNINNITYGDLNGDNSTDAVILSNCNTGGTGQFSEGFIYGMKNGKPELLARIPGGDRADGGLRSAKVENGLLVVDANDNSQGGGACCPEYAVTTKYRLEGKTLKEVGKGVKRELYPAQRVNFDKGATKTTLTVSFKKDDDIKRFKVGARAGQTLIVTTNSKDVSISLDGEAETTDGENSLTAKLQKSGDFVIQLQKISDAVLSVSLTIEIQ